MKNAEQILTHAMKREDISRILLIQTAYIGDVILMTPLVESLREIVPTAHIDVLINHSNASVLAGHPHINELLLWNKKNKKTVIYWGCYKKFERTNMTQYSIAIGIFLLDCLLYYPELIKKLGFIVDHWFRGMIFRFLTSFEETSMKWIVIWRY